VEVLSQSRRHSSNLDKQSRHRQIVGLPNSPTEEGVITKIAKWSTIIGVVLCVLILIYLGHVTRRAMDVELEDEEGANNNTSTVLPLHNRQHSGHEREEEAAAATPDERAAFLVHGPDDSDDEQGIAMSEARLANRTRSR
jgi:hypothetical protein